MMEIAAPKPSDVEAIRRSGSMAAMAAISKHPASKRMIIAIDSCRLDQTHNRRHTFSRTQTTCEHHVFATERDRTNLVLNSIIIVPQVRTCAGVVGNHHRPYRDPIVWSRNSSVKPTELGGAATFAFDVIQDLEALASHFKTSMTQSLDRHLRKNFMPNDKFNSIMGCV